jgi:hypothetical protein
MLDAGDTAWLLVSAAFVLFMIPGLAMFYGGMIRAKGVLNMIMMCFIAIATVSVVWVLYGYSFTYSEGPGGIIGGVEFIAMNGLLAEEALEGTIPASVDVGFQLMFAAITVALIAGAIAERAKFSAWVVFRGVRGGVGPATAARLARVDRLLRPAQGRQCPGGALKLLQEPDRAVDACDAAGKAKPARHGQRPVECDCRHENLLVFIPPHRPPAPVAAAGFSPAGWIPVDAETLATSASRVWALGDVASITLTNGKPLPKAAVFAKGQAPAVAAGVAKLFGYGGSDDGLRFTGEGYCYLETGGQSAARGAGNFYHPDGPQITLSPPSAELHQAKEREEADWINQWSRA